MAHPSRKQCILIVDDDPFSITILFDALRDNYRIRTAENGPDALEAVHQTPVPDLILLDIMMPGMDGFEILHRLKSHPHTAEIPVIFTTALNSTEDEIKGLRMGAVDYIPKPIHIDILVTRVRTHMELKRHQDLLRSEREAYAQANSQLEMEIAARRNMAAALKESELKYRQVFENTGSATIIFDDRDTILMANSRCESLTGYRRCELEGRRKWTEFVPPEELTEINRARAQSVQEGVAGDQGFELRLICKNGRLRDILVEVAPWPESRRWIASWIDITDRRRAEQALKENQAYLQAVMETVEAGVLISDPASGRIRDINPHGARLMGSSAQNLIGRDISRMLNHDDPLPVLEEQACPGLEGSVAALKTVDERTIPVRHASADVQLNGRSWAIHSFQEIVRSV